MAVTILSGICAFCITSIILMKAEINRLTRALVVGQRSEDMLVLQITRLQEECTDLRESEKWYAEQNCHLNSEVTRLRNEDKEWWEKDGLEAE